MGDVERSVAARACAPPHRLGSFLAARAARGTRSVGALSALLPSVLVGLLSWQAFRERRAKSSLIEQRQPLVGMRRPTPINRPFGSQPRAESGTRFKAARPIEGQKKADEESA